MTSTRVSDVDDMSCVRDYADKTFGQNNGVARPRMLASSLLRNRRAAFQLGTSEVAGSIVARRFRAVIADA